MFAGAAREAVSNEAIAKKISSAFVPVALKAAHVDRPGSDLEGRLYQEVRRTRPAPQGFCVVNSAGQVLNWALSFDEEESFEKFLEHCLARYANHPDGKANVEAERHRRFPSAQMPSVPDSGKRVELPKEIGNDEIVSSVIRVAPGSRKGRVVGRALSEDGKLREDTTRQENYVEDLIRLPAEGERTLVERALSSDGKSFLLPKGAARALIDGAYLGQLDVNPIGGRRVRGVIDRERIHFAAIADGERKEGDQTLQRFLLVGSSDAAGRHDPKVVGDSRRWNHRVALSWQGYLLIDAEKKLHRLVMLGEGEEFLRWDNRAAGSAENPIAHLPSGRPLKFKTRVRYGVVIE